MIAQQVGEMRHAVHVEDIQDMVETSIMENAWIRGSTEVCALPL